MRKKFDCLELQHRGGEKVQARLAGMTHEERVAYWEQRGEDLRKIKESRIEQRKAS
jgi:hypothetical protein